MNEPDQLAAFASSKQELERALGNLAPGDTAIVIVVHPVPQPMTVAIGGQCLSPIEVTGVLEACKSIFLRAFFGGSSP